MNSETHEKGVNTLIVKTINTRIVLKELRARRVSTVKELAAASELTVATVTAIVQDLKERGRLYEGGLIPSLGGRPSRQYLFNETYSLALVLFAREIDGRDAVCLRVLDLYGQALDSQTHQMDEITMDALESLIAATIDRYPSIGAVSIGLPGIELGGTIVALDYRSLIGEPIVSRLGDRFNIPVNVENDVNAAALGYCAANDSDGTVVYVYFPRKYGPGAGITVSGTLLKGRNHAAGEVARLPLGIDWGPELTYDFDRFIEAASDTLLGIAAVLDPDTFVLYGEYLTERHLGALLDALGRMLPPTQILPEIRLASDFSADFERGLSDLALRRLLD